MADKTYPHALFEVAHPTVSTLIRQAIEIRKFQLIFPELFGVLRWARLEIYKHLVIWLTQLLKQRNEYENEQQLQNDLLTIIFERRLLDKVIVYITTGKIEYDEYVTHHLLTKNKYLDYFEFLREIWDGLLEDYFSEYDVQKYFQPITYENGERRCSAMDAVFNVIEKNGWYLPNLLVDWDVKSLFADYYVLFLEYHIYKNNRKDTPAPETTREPTVLEASERLKILLKRYPLPFYYEFDSCVNIIEEKSVDKVDNILNLKFNLNNDVHNLPKLLESFILNLQSRKVDIFKKGVRENFINKNNFEFQRSAKLVKDLLNALNPILNKNCYLDRADSLISTLAMLIYIDEIFESLFVDEKLRKNWQDYNVTIIQYSYLKHESVVDYLKLSRDKRNEEISKVKKVKYSEFVKKLMSVFELRHDSLTAVYLKREGKNVIEVTLKENNFIEVIDVESLRKSINRMIENAFTNDEEKAKTDQSLDPFGLGDIFTVAISGRSSG